MRALMPASTSVRIVRERFQAPRQRVPIGAAALENAERAAYQSARSKDGYLAPLPLTLADALAEAFPKP